MTIDFPAPVIPAGYTILQAMALGLLPAQTKILNQGVGRPANTVAHLLSVGFLSPGALASTLVFDAPNANYAGN
jgi:hypothetical protein